MPCLSALRELVDFPCSVRGPVECSDGRQPRSNRACRSLRFWIHPLPDCIAVTRRHPFGFVRHLVCAFRDRKLEGEPNKNWLVRYRRKPRLVALNHRSGS